MSPPEPGQAPRDGRDEARSPENPRPGRGGLFDQGHGVLDRALAVVEYLRAHCEWDRKQTARSLVPHLLEEMHETVDAILDGSSAGLRGELGDLLLNIAFQIVVAEESGLFVREEVVSELERKMIRRHPHLFGDGEKRRWESIKAEEESGSGPPETLHGLASGLDPLLRAHRIQEKVAGVGFDWEQTAGAIEKTREELEEVEEALEAEGSERLEEELGDLLFSVVNVTRLAGAHARLALDAANRKFEFRFGRLEELAAERGIAIPGASLEALDELWEEVKGEAPPGISTPPPDPPRS